MKLCQYNDNRAGSVVDGSVYPIGDALVRAGHLRSGYSMLEAVDRLSSDTAAMALARNHVAAGAPLPLASVKLLAPISNPPAIWAAAANYRAHQNEMKSRVGSYDRTQMSKDDLMAEFFIKPVSSLVGPGGPVVLPKVSKHVDFECELCAVIGKTARHVNEAQALDHVFGYTICWDISQRDPWGKGVNNTRNIRKGFDTFTGLGPWIVTRDEVPEPQNLSIHVEQNGKEVMVAHTSDMICGLRDHIRFLSDVLTLQSGVLITTGTPAGVSRLADGDRLKGTIERIGTMEMVVVAER